jgi:cytoskeletal protein CcmA (bactofilin family)
MADPNEIPGSIVIGEGVIAKGTFHVPGRAVINGSLEGELEAKEIIIGKNGRGIGHFRAESAELSGEMQDTLQTTVSLIIRPTGKVTGSVFYREIEINKGGEIEGRMNQGAPPAPHNVNTPAAKTVTPADAAAKAAPSAPVPTKSS